MPQPVLLPFVGDVLGRLDAGQMEAWQERSAIIEFDAGLSRPLAEALALIELLRRHPAILSDVQAMAVELDGCTQWLVTNSLAHARQVIGEMGGFEVGCPPVSDVLRDQYSGIAVLGTLG